MCHISCILFGVNHLSIEDIEGKSVLDIGSYNYNGNFAQVVKRLKPSKFVGIDMLPGPGVDIVCLGEDAVKTFGKESFDVVIASELMEHTRNWRDVISNIKNVCKPGGLLIITTRSKGFKLHGYPNDYWRYELSDMREIFSDCTIEVLESDPEAPGVFLRAIKPVNFKENNLANVSLYSIIEKRRIQNIDEAKEKAFQRKYGFYRKLLRMKRRFEGGLYQLCKKVLSF